MAWLTSTAMRATIGMCMAVMLLLTAPSTSSTIGANQVAPSSPAAATVAATATTATTTSSDPDTRASFRSQYPNDNDRCTTIAMGTGATVDQSTLLTYNADCAECDWRVNKVPAKDWPAGSMRPVYLLSGAYPRQVRSDRGATWMLENLEDLPQRAEWEKLKNKEIIGHIPQVPHTYALIEGLYGIMNEYQVAIGESTCAAKLWAAPAGAAGGKALLEASELSQLGLERGKTAREAIQVMGDLAVQYGFYSADWDGVTHGPTGPEGEGGEALTVSDPHEAWVFHVIPDDTGASAVWVAQRVPDDHVAVVANAFIIRDIVQVLFDTPTSGGPPLDKGLDRA